MNLTKYVADFLLYLEHEKKYSKHTVIAYNSDLKSVELDNLTKDKVQKLIMQKNANAMSAASIKRLLSTISTFIDYLVLNHILPDNFITGIITPKLPKKLPKTIDYEQITLMLKTKNNSILELRNSAVIYTLYSSALRVSELCALKINDINYNEGFIKILGKGNKQRYTPIGKNALTAIQKYLSQRADNNIYLFINNRGSNLSSRTIQNIVKNKAIMAGINFNIHPHMLRHAAASHMLQSSHDLRTVQEYLGHKNITSTQVYTHLNFQELAKVYDKCHPRAHKS